MTDVDGYDYSYARRTEAPRYKAVGEHVYDTTRADGYSAGFLDDDTAQYVTQLWNAGRYSPGFEPHTYYWRTDAERIAAGTLDPDRDARIAYENLVDATEPEPVTVDMLDGLGENAYVAHRTDSGWAPYVKRKNSWYEIQRSGKFFRTDSNDVLDYIENCGFEIIFKGVEK